MKKTVLIACVTFFMAACNDSANESSVTDSTAKKDNTNMYDTGAGSSMTDTAHRMKDTSLLPNKMQDTGVKK